MGVWDESLGMAQNIVKEGDFVFIASWQGGLNVFEYNTITDSYSFCDSWEYSSDYCEAVAVADGVAYLAYRGRGIYVLNVSDPYNIEYITRWDNGGSAYDVQIVGDYAHIADYADGYEIINIANPASPSFVSNTFNGTDYKNEICVNDTLAFVSLSSHGVDIYDITNLASPVKIGYYSNGGVVFDIVIKDEYAYLATGSNGLYVLDVSTPSSPIVVDIFDAPTVNTFGMCFEGNYLYTADITFGLKIYDISNPTDIQSVANFTMSTTNTRKPFYSDNKIHIAGYSMICAIDVSTPSAPFSLAVYNFGDAVNDVAVVGNFAYLACETEGLVVLDISDLGNPQKIGWLGNPTILEASCVEVVDDLCFVGDSSFDLKIVNISDPYNPTLHSEIVGISPVFWDMKIKGDYIWVATGNLGLGCVNITDIDNPSYVGAVGDGNTTRDLVLDGNFAYCADGYGGLEVFNIADPSNFYEVGEYFSTGDCYGVWVEGNYAITANRWNGIEILDIDDPTNITNIATIDDGEFALDVHVEGDLIYVADYIGIEIINWSNPASPFEVAEFNDDDGNSIDLDAINGIIFVADSMGGLEILKHDSDLDTVSDYVEVHQFGTDPNDNDTDDDRLLDGYEIYTSLTDPTKNDTDDDFINDYTEIYYSFTDPLDNDTDDDGLLDGEEIEQREDGFITDPLDADTDDDGISDGDEYLEGSGDFPYRTDPTNEDTDGDGLTDHFEQLPPPSWYFTNPLVADTDGDSYDDGEEYDAGTDPTDPDDYPGITTPTPSPTVVNPLFGGLLVTSLVSFSILALIVIRRKK